MSATISGQREGFNGSISIGGYGIRYIRAVSLDLNVQIMFQEDDSANYKSYYPMGSMPSGFAVLMVFLSSAERDSFNAWMRTAMERMARGSLSSAVVSVPVRRFLRRGVPRGRLVYGASVGQISFPTTMNFVGATSQVAPASPTVSFFKNAPAGSSQSYFYPAGKQLTGTESTPSAIYDLQTPQQAYTAGRASGLISGTVSYGNYLRIIGEA